VRGWLAPRVQVGQRAGCPCRVACALADHYPCSRWPRH